MNLVEQIFAQAQMGTGQASGNPFAEGMRLGQNQQQLNMERERLNAELGLLPLKRKMAEQEQEMNSAKLEQMLHSRDSQAAGEKAFAGLQAAVQGDLAEKHDYMSAWAAALDYATKNQEVLSAPQWEPFANNLSKLANTAESIAVRKEQNDIRLAESLAKFDDPALRTARNTADLKSQLRASEAATSRVAEMTPELSVELERQQNLRDQIAVMESKAGVASSDKPQSQIGKILADRNAAFKAGDTAAVASYDAELKGRQAKMGFTITRLPDGTISVTQGPVSSDMTTSERTKTADELASTVDALRPLGQLRGAISPTTVGPAASVSSVVFDRILSNLVPGVANQERIAGRGLIDISNEELIGKLNESNRLSEAEMARIRAMLPGKGIVSSPVEGQAKVNTLIRVLGEKGVTEARKLGRAIPPEVLTALAYLSNDELEADVQAGYLDGSVIPQIIQARRAGGR